MEPTLLVGDRSCLLPNILMDIANIHFLLVHLYYLRTEYYFQIQIEEMWLYLKHLPTIEQIISKG